MTAQVDRSMREVVARDISAQAGIESLSREYSFISTRSVSADLHGLSIVDFSIDHGGTFKHELSKGGLAPWQKRRASQMLEANLEEPPTLQKLAQSCSLSASHFAKAFKQSFGYAPHQWLLRRRVAHAHELMKSTRASLADISLACGFFDQSHFSRVFNRLTGLTPAVWRRRNRALIPQFA